jgi:Domain of unknown function (DUF4403)
MCRSISLAGVAAGTPNLWLKLKPIRALASQPLIDASNATVTLGVEAQSRIISSESKPDCPFPASYFGAELEQSALIDLKPYVVGASRGIEAVIAEYDRQDDTLSTVPR